MRNVVCKFTYSCNSLQVVSFTSSEKFRIRITITVCRHSAKKTNKSLIQSVFDRKYPLPEISCQISVKSLSKLLKPGVDNTGQFSIFF